MVDIGQLREMIAVYPSNMRVTDDQGNDIVFIVNQIGEDRVILSKNKPLGECNRCGGYVFPTDTVSEHEYSAYCPGHDEDLFKHEFTPIEEIKADEENL